MADYFTQFACVLDVGSADNIVQAIQLHREMELAYAAFEQSEIGFAVTPDGPTTLLIHDGDSFGDQKHVIKFVLRCAAEFDLRGRWGLTWALTCSRPRPGGFGGGAQLLDLTARKSLDWIDCDHWLARELAEDDDPGGGSAPASVTDDPSGPPLAGRSVSGGCRGARSRSTARLAPGRATRSSAVASSTASRTSRPGAIAASRRPRPTPAGRRFRPRSASPR